MTSGGCMDLWAVVPEMIVAGMALALVPLAGWARGRWRRVPAAAAVVGLAAATVLMVPMLAAEPAQAFCGTYAYDPYRGVFQLLLALAAAVTILVLASHLRGTQQEPHAPVAVLFATAGGMGLVAATDLGLIVLFLQMVSFPSYILVALVRTDRAAQEAALKYFIFGATALAVMAYGLTFLFGLTGSLNLRDIGADLAGADAAWVAFALALVILGYGFETTLVPFHFWAPDAFQGATAPAAGFVSVVPKIAAFGGLLRFLLEAMPDGLSGWPLLLAIISAVTMTYGNLAALRQATLKRLLAYSSIAQAGYIAMATAAAAVVPGALAAVGYYLLAYLLMNLAAFAAVAQIERTTGRDDFEVVEGLGYQAPWMTAALTLALLSLAGIPPLAGFAGKVFLLAVTIEGGFAWLAVIGAANMAAALFYYARIVARMYFRKPEGHVVLAGGAGYVAALGLTSAGTILLGLLPGLGLHLTQLATFMV